MIRLLALVAVVFLTACSPVNSEKPTHIPKSDFSKKLDGAVQNGVYRDPEGYMAFTIPSDFFIDRLFEDSCGKDIAKFGCHNGKGDYIEVTAYNLKMLPFIESGTPKGLTEVRRFELSLINPKFPGISTLREEFRTLSDTKQVKFLIIKVPSGGTIFNIQLNRVQDATKGMFFFFEQDKVVILSYQHTYTCEGEDSFPKTLSGMSPFLYDKLVDIYQRIKINPKAPERI